MRVYEGDILSLKPNQIFIFGSNTEGRHGKGAALIAKERFGAIYGQAEGLQGQSYAIITKDLTKSVHPSRTPEQIKEQIKKLYEFAIANPDKEFLVAYKTSGTNLNAYSSKEMADMFNFVERPKNIIFEKTFSELINIKTKKTMETTGKLKSKFDTVQVSDKFAKREFVLTTELNTPYPQHVSFQLTQDKCNLLDSINEGDDLKVLFNLRGREWNGPQGLKYFNTLEAWRIEKLAPGTIQTPAAAATSKTNVTASEKSSDAPVFTSSSNDDSDDMPF